MIPYTGLPNAIFSQRLGEDKKALAAYENLIRDELVSKNDLDMLVLIISRYRQYLMAHVPVEEAVSRFLHIVSKDVNVASLLETARFYEESGNVTEARAWYYRAVPYRLSFRWSGICTVPVVHGERTVNARK